MSRRMLSFAGIALLLCAAGPALAQEAQESATQHTPAAAQDPAAVWTVIEYPEGSEVVVELKPTGLLPDAKGTAKVMRSGDETTIMLDVSGLDKDAGSYHLYAVSQEGKVSPLGVVTPGESVATLSAKTNLNRFMLVLSTDTDLTAMDAALRIALVSAVPEGFAVVPRAGDEMVAEVAEEPTADMGAAEMATSDERLEYDVPLLGIPSLRRGAETQLKSQLAGDLSDVRTGVIIKPLKNGSTKVKVRFYNLKEASDGAQYVLWAVAPDKTYSRLGHAGRPNKQHATKIETQTALSDFGLFITMEGEAATLAPTGPTVAMFVR